MAELRVGVLACSDSRADGAEETGAMRLIEAIRDRAGDCHRQNVLSRATVGTRGHTLVVNLPGGPELTLEAFATVDEYLPAAVARLNGAPAELGEPAAQ